MPRTVRMGIGATVLALVLIVLVPAPAEAAVWGSSAQWASWSSGGSTLYNNNDSPLWTYDADPTGSLG